MLGVRLDAATEQALDALARRTRRSKSDIAREAVRGYVRRHAETDDAVAQWRAISEAERRQVDISMLLDEAAADLWRTD